MNDRIRLTIFVSLFLTLFSERSWALGWSWNLGYNNPPGALVGLNFMRLGSKVAFEVGIGGVQQSKGTDSTTNQETKSISLLGDINLKYLFRDRVFRPYVQIGAGSSASVVTNSGASAGVGVGGAYYGAGFFIIPDPGYGYFSLNSGGGSGYFQFGLGSFF